MKDDKKIARWVYAVVKVLNRQGVFPTASTVQRLTCLVLAENDEALFRRTYRPYIYGPASDDVAFVLEALVLAGYLTDDTADDTKSSVRRFRVAKEKELEEEKATERFLKKLSPAVLQDARLLANMTVLLWLIKKRSEFSPKSMCETARSLGWKLSFTEAIEAMKELDKLSAELVLSAC